MGKRQDGFTMVELMITMVVFMIAMAAAANIFTALLGQFKQQSKIAESNIEGMIGLQMMRADIEQAGFGLPWNMNGATYTEAANDSATVFDDMSFNDSTGNPPRAVVIGNNVGWQAASPNVGSDVLVLKATSLGMSAPVQKWTYVGNIGGAVTPRTWGVISADNPAENLALTDNVIFVNPSSGSVLSNQRLLINDGGDFNTTLGTYAGTAFEPSNFASYVVYGITPAGSTPRMPFNRVDYYIKQPAAPPSRCEPSTGVLYKGVINHADGKHTDYPILDCVADMQVVFIYLSGSPLVPIATQDMTPFADAAALRSQLKEIRVYIIAHEGQKDITYQSPATIDIIDRDANATSPYIIKSYTVPDRNYRWKLYTLVVTPHIN